MTLLMRDQENVKKGEEMLAKLTMPLNEDGRFSEVVKVSQDKEYRQKVYVEYHIIWEQGYPEAEHTRCSALFVRIICGYFLHLGILRRDVSQVRAIC